MFVDFLFELRRLGVKVGTHEWLTLMEALAKGLHDSSLDGFYRVARAICCKDESDLDGFDQAFMSYFKDAYAASIDLSEELLSWLRDPKKFAELSDEQRRMIESIDLDRLRQMLEERLKEQKERHDGGSKWVGTGGTSPFGHSGYHPSGIRIGGPGGGRNAMQVAEQRRFRDYRKDIVLDVRQIDLALRGLRRLGREGSEEELDLDGTVEATGRNAGDLEIIFQPPKRNRLKLVLLMDVGGSMDPFARLVERLFTAASRSGRFAKFRHYYFHNCVYEEVYEDAAFRKPVSLDDLLSGSDREERLVVVGDALMHPAELMQSGGAIWYYQQNANSGLNHLKRLEEYFHRTVWLNPEPKRYWPHTTIEVIADVFPMFQLTLAGLEEAVRFLVRGGKRPSLAA